MRTTRKLEGTRAVASDPVATALSRPVLRWTDAPTQRGGYSTIFAAHRAAATACIVALALGAFASSSLADITATYSFTLTGANIPDGSGDFADMRTLGGFASYSNVAVNLNLGSQNASNPMYLGDLYSTLTIGLPSEAERTAVLLNRPGRDNGVNNYYGSSLSSLNVTLDDSISRPNIWGTTTGTGTYNSDGRLGTNPYGSPIAYDLTGADRNATLTTLAAGGPLTSNRFTLLVADTQASGLARLNSWGMAVTGTSTSGNGTMGSGGGTLSITDDGGTNTIGANVDTTQNGSGGVLNVTATGNLTFSGAMSGSGGLTKAGAGTVILSNATGNSYTGNTTVNAGTLLANNTSGSATGTGSVQVNNGGTLGGSGIISGAVTVGTPMGMGGTLRGGTGTSTTDTLTLSGAVTMNTGSIIELALGAAGAHSTLAITGSITFTTNQMFHFIDLGAAAGMYNNIITGVTNPNMGTSWDFSDANWTYMFMYDNAGSIDLTLTPVPEPGTWAAGILTVLALCWTQRKRFAKRFRVIS